MLAFLSTQSRNSAKIIIKKCPEWALFYLSEPVDRERVAEAKKCRLLDHNISSWSYHIFLLMMATLSWGTRQAKRCCLPRMRVILRVKGSMATCLRQMMLLVRPARSAGRRQRGVMDDGDAFTTVSAQSLLEIKHLKVFSYWSSVVDLEKNNAKNLVLIFVLHACKMKIKKLAWS